METKQLAAPCGLYCGVCAIYIAHRDDNLKFKERLTGLYGVGLDDLHCKGCLSDDVFLYCRVCPIKACTAAPPERGSRAATSAPISPAGTSTPSPSQSAKGSSSAPFPPGGSWELLAGWRRRRSAITVPTAEAPSSGGRSAAGAAARPRIWIEGGNGLLPAGFFDRRCDPKQDIYGNSQGTEKKKDSPSRG